MAAQKEIEQSMIGPGIRWIEVRTEAGEIIARIEAQTAEVIKGFVIALSYEKTEEEK